PDDPPDAAAQLPREHPTSGLWDENKVILAIPADVRLALPVSHENLLPSDRGGSLQGGLLLQFYARRNGRASASLTARGGGLTLGVSRSRSWWCPPLLDVLGGISMIELVASVPPYSGCSQGRRGKATGADAGGAVRKTRGRSWYHVGQACA